MAKDTVRRSTAGLVLSALLCLVAAPARAEDTTTGTPKKNAFLWLNDISGWNAIDDEHLVLYGSGRRKIALVTTIGPCVGLRKAENIAVESSRGYIDERGFGDIIYRGAGGIRFRCAMKTAENVENLEDARRLVAQRKADGKARSPTP